MILVCDDVFVTESANQKSFLAKILIQKHIIDLDVKLNEFPNKDCETNILLHLVHL